MSDKKLSILVSSILLFTLLVLTASANNDYPNVGGKDYVFNNSKGIFRSTLSTSITGSDSLSSPSLQPLFADLDGDGVGETVIKDGDTIKIYSGSTWVTAINSYDYNNFSITGNHYYRDLIYDFDGDGKKEIIFAHSSGSSAPHYKLKIVSFEYNGTDIYPDHNFDISNTSAYSGSVGGQFAMGCRGVDDCAIAYFHSNVNTNNELYFVTFSSTQKTSVLTLIDDNAGVANRCYCMPDNSELIVKDYDVDGVVEYVFSFIVPQLSANGGSDGWIYYVNPDTLTLEHSVDIVMFGLTVQATDTCDSLIPQRYITVPLVAEITGGGALETVIGVMLSDHSFELRSYTSSGVLIRSYPNVFSADGQLISNPILTNVFGSGLKSDFCVLGYIVASNSLDLLCGTETSVFSFLGFPTIHSDEFVTSNLNENNLKSINIRSDGGLRTELIHSSNQGFTSDVEDIVTSYGIFSADFSRINFLGLSSNSSLNLNYVADFQNGSVLMVNGDNDYYSDMVILADNNLWYINDNFVNSAGQITSISTNPCINDVWKLNTTVQVRVKVEDVDGDKVASRVIFYNNDSDVSMIQDSGWSNNFSSGTTFTFVFKANKTVSTGYIDVFGRDVYNPLSEDLQELLFTVASEGLVFGDSECTPFSENLTIIVGGTTTTLAGSVNLQNNSLKNIFDSPIVQSFGLGYTVMWLILMVIIGGGVWVYGSHINPLISVGVVGLLEFLLFVIGAFLGFIPTGVIVTIVVVGLLVIGVWVASFFTKT